MKFFALCLLLLCGAAQATSPKPHTPASPPKSQQAQDAFARADARAAARASSSTGDSTSSSDSSGGSNALGSIAPSQSIGGDASNHRAWSLVAPPLAFTPPMAAMQGCSPDVTQSALGVGAGLFSRADSHADPQDCTLITLMNSMIESCAYESARQVRGLMVQKKLPGFALSDVKFHDYTPQECSLLRAPAPVPAPPVVNYISAAPLPAPNCEATPITSPAKVSAPQRRAKKAAVVRRSCP